MNTQICWRECKKYEGLYRVNNEGLIFSISKGKVLKPEVHGRGYLRVNLVTKEGKRKHEYVQRLVAEAFIPNVSDSKFVKHKNGDLTDNRAINLDWESSTKTNKSIKTRENTSPKFNCKPVKCIETGEVFFNAREAESKTGAWNPNISNVCLGKRKTAGGYHWEFVENFNL